VFTTHGLPCSLYTDRGSHYFTTLKAGGRVNRGDPTQVGRRKPASQTGPAADRRAPHGEFHFGAFGKDSSGVDTVAAEQPGSAFVPVSGIDLREVLCCEEERQVAPDNTVPFQRVLLQIPPGPLRAHYVRATVRVRRYADGPYGVFHGPRCIGRYDPAGLALAERSKLLERRRRVKLLDTPSRRAARPPRDGNRADNQSATSTGQVGVLPTGAFTRPKPDLDLITSRPKTVDSLALAKHEGVPASTAERRWLDIAAAADTSRST
jgi:hypothetical protein